MKNPSNSGQSFNKATSRVISRSEFANIYLNADGTHTTEVSPTPLNVSTANGWVTPSTSLVHSSTSGWGVGANPLSPRFADNASANGVFSVARGSYTVSFSLDGAKSRVAQRRPVSPLDAGMTTVSGDLAYLGVFDGVDLSYQVGRNQVKEALILAQAPLAANSTFTWSVTAPGLTLVKNADGNLLFQDASGVTQFVVPAPAMWDSSGVPGVRESVYTMVPTTVKQVGNTWKVTLSPDRGWLTDPSRVYPVVVDPTVYMGFDVGEGYKSDGAMAPPVRIGNTLESTVTDYLWRTVIHYPYEQVFGKQVIGVNLQATLTSGTPNCYVGEVYTAAAYNFNGYNTDLGAWQVCGGTTDANYIQGFNLDPPIRLGCVFDFDVAGFSGRGHV